MIYHDDKIEVYVGGELRLRTDDMAEAVAALKDGIVGQLVARKLLNNAKVQYDKSKGTKE
jgi:hypothetical protein